MIADELIEDYRNATVAGEGGLDAIGTMGSWIDAANEHSEEFQEDDRIALMQELACRAAGRETGP
jgi:hypothetical protein